MKVLQKTVLLLWRKCEQSQKSKLSPKPFPFFWGQTTTTKEKIVTYLLNQNGAGQFVGQWDQIFFSKLLSVKKGLGFLLPLMSLIFSSLHCCAVLFTSFFLLLHLRIVERVKQYFLDRSISKTTTVRNNLLLTFLCTKFMNYDGRFFQFFLHTLGLH